MAAKDSDRFIHHLVTTNVITEELYVNGQGFINAVIKVTTAIDC